MRIVLATNKCVCVCVNMTRQPRRVYNACMWGVQAEVSMCTVLELTGVCVYKHVLVSQGECTTHACGMVCYWSKTRWRCVS